MTTLLCTGICKVIPGDVMLGIVMCLFFLALLSLVLMARLEGKRFP